MVKFRLEKVLSHRQALETLAQQAMALAVQQEKELQELLRQARDEMAISAGEFEGRKRVGVEAFELLLYQAQHDRRAEQIIDLQRRLGEAAREVECRREALVAASMDKQLLEKLKEKQVAELNAGLQHQENGVLDEIAIQKFNER